MLSEGFSSACCDGRNVWQSSWQNPLQQAQTTDKSTLFNIASYVAFFGSKPTHPRNPSFWDVVFPKGCKGVRRLAAKTQPCSPDLELRGLGPTAFSHLGQIWSFGPDLLTGVLFGFF